MSAGAHASDFVTPEGWTPEGWTPEGWTPEGWTRLRLAVALEGATLIALVFVASPLKRLADMPEATQVMGPVHGLAFLFFLYVLVEALAARMVGGWAGLRLALGAFVPFGGVVNERWLARKARMARKAQAAATRTDEGTAT